MASVGSTGWPYLQHRGGDVGFLKVLGPARVGWIERNGNRQYISAGNIQAEDRVSLILVDYPSRRRLKLYGRAQHIVDADETLLNKLEVIAPAPSHDGAIVVDIVAFDWNCPKYITQRFTAEDVRAVTTPLHERIADLETRLAGQRRD